MRTYLDEVSKNLYAFLVWDESWNSYNNCYLLVEKNNIILIDSGKEEHSHFLFSTLRKKGISKSDITHFIATHGHKDHIGGTHLLGEIECYIHSEDIELIPENLKNKLQMKLPDTGSAVSNLECVLLGHHTKGSVLLYQPESKVLFCGDHICFFGEQLSGNVVDYGASERGKYKQFVSEWSQNEEMRKQHNFSLFIEGLKKINKYHIEYLCTGHGVVLKGQVNEFISELLDFE